MRPPSRQTVKRDLHALAIGTFVGLLIVGIAAGFFIAVWGWNRFWVDFYPPDRSPVGPNMLASCVTVILVTAHNEARLVQKNAAHHVSLEQTLRDMIDSVIHPVETAEDSVAQRVIEGQNDGV